MKKKIRVLFIEDSDNDVKLMLRSLNSIGMEIAWRQIEKADEMREALAKEDWDIIISDYHLPLFSAHSALEILNELGIDLPFITVSGSIGEDTAVEIMKSGAHDYVMKDNLTRLGPAIERKLREAQARREKKRANEEIRLSEERLESLYRLSQMTESSDIELMNVALKEGVRLTGSKLGYLYFTVREGSYGSFIFSENVSLPCREQIVMQIGADRNRQWAECFDTRLPFIHNEHEDKHDIESCPEEHPHLTRHMGVPVFEGQNIVTVAGVGNKHEKYDETDVRQLSLFMNEMWKIIQRRQTEAERRALEARIAQIQKMDSIGRLAGGVAHDFNNLLTVILGNSELMFHRITDKTSPMYELLSEIIKASEKAKELTHQLLTFGRKQCLVIRTLNLNEIIGNFEKMLRRLIGENIKITTALDSNLHRINADAAQLEQILMNMAVNARDAMEQGGDLFIETSNMMIDKEYAETHPGLKAGPAIVLTFRDTGCGMVAETLQHIFEPFFTTKMKGKGTGLGLSMVYGIIAQHGGHINVYSEPEKGTTFRIYLPSAVESNIAKEEPVSSEKSAAEEIRKTLDADMEMREI